MILHMLFAIVTYENWNIDQMNIIIIYLNNYLFEEEVIYMKISFEMKNVFETICYFNKTLYEFKQFERYWNIIITNVILKELFELHFHRSKYDHCMFISINQNDIVIIIIYVNDLLLFSNSHISFNKIKKLLIRKFEMKDMNIVKCYIDIDITHNHKNRIFIFDQSIYITEIINRYDMIDNKIIFISLNSFLSLQKFKDNDIKIDETSYHQINDNLIYDVIHIHIDIAFLIFKFSQFNSNSNQIHYMIIKYILRYLNESKDLFIVYNDINMSLNIVEHTDTNWRNDFDNHRSITEFAFILNDELIIFESKRQLIVTLSIMKTKLMTFYQNVKETIVLQWLFTDIQNPSIFIITIYIDNQMIITHIKNLTEYVRIKYIDIKHHFTQETFVNDVIDIKYISTEEMIVNVLIKSLFRIKHERCIVTMRMQKN